MSNPALEESKSLRLQLSMLSDIMNIELIEHRILYKDLVNILNQNILLTTMLRESDQAFLNSNLPRNVVRSHSHFRRYLFSIVKEHVSEIYAFINELRR
jgi:hypothetical protein